MTIMNLQGPVEIPQEIIDTIVGQLSGHDDALRSCSLVSRSFLDPSHRNLFAIILLDGIEKTKRLHELLMFNSQLSSYIRDLTFVVAIPVDMTAQRLLSDWLQAHDNALTSILRNVPHLRHLALGDFRSYYLDWNMLSSDLQSVLSELFQSPFLATIKIFRFTNLLNLKGPNNHRIFPHVKNLMLNKVTWGGPVTELVMPNLEVLDVETVVFPPTLVPNLQHLFIRSDGYRTAMFVVGVIRSSSRSLQRILWNYCGPLAPPIDLGIVENLQHLAFFTIKAGGDLLFERLNAVIEYLKDRAVTKCLKELVISLRIFEIHSYATLENLSDFEGWKVLDQAMSTVHTLEKATINLDFLWYPSIGAGITQASQTAEPYMRQCLPLLDSRGVLSIVSGSTAGLETLLWPRGN